MDNAAEIQISVGFLDPSFITPTNISQHSSLVTKAISNAMNNDYLVGAYYTSHWITVIIFMKFRGVWYLDFAKQHPPLKFSDLKSLWTGQYLVGFVHKKSIS
jgi:hypothetical protein